ncbi:uncharacterized protein NEPG_02390 [Nematocida parisii ERTm1]|uniref:Uncharacterized protein n=1 Tax=Nematocida parisii (strain ERTm3) TaxID=935791 RepID=I3EHU4_NEMP3|nr:uncharacterized protein NEPG_02390 [Nematocida parisii ERTm1]EIJ88791.1 hypothetical protein NEQG_00610 [Nematocida parisii ERTm3]EIJ92699.1 hypothetical protein NEPG_02390 [Nematocida parisii ERTm1]|eukprot:XP_013060217.1 hypothetical protein NEPG_02390 [Nematocida parisii ERTm1]
MYSKKQVCMNMRYKLYAFLSILYTVSARHSDFLSWDFRRSNFHPSPLQDDSSFRNAVANITDLRKESIDIMNEGKEKPPYPNDESLVYPGENHMGYLYVPFLKAPLGIKKKEIGYDPLFGVGSDYEKVMFSIYHKEEDQSSPVVFLVNNKNIAKEFVNTYNIENTPKAESVPGLQNNNHEVSVGPGPLLSKSFKILGVSSRYKNYRLRGKKEKGVIGKAVDLLSLNRQINKYQEFALQSELDQEFVSVPGKESHAKFVSELKCNENPQMCTFIWVPYKEENNMIRLW